MARSLAKAGRLGATRAIRLTQDYSRPQCVRPLSSFPGRFKSPISDEAIRKLIKLTGHSFWECRQALISVNGNVDDALGIMNLSCTIPVFGGAAALSQGQVGAAIVIKSTTDVSNCGTFHGLLLEISQRLLSENADGVVNCGTFQTAPIADKFRTGVGGFAVPSVAQYLELVGNQIGCQLQLVQGVRLAVKTGCVSCHTTGAQGPYAGRVAVLCSLETTEGTDTEVSPDALHAVGAQIADLAGLPTSALEPSDDPAEKTPGPVLGSPFFHGVAHDIVAEGQATVTETFGHAVRLHGLARLECRP